LHLYCDISILRPALLIEYGTHAGAGEIDVLIGQQDSSVRERTAPVVGIDVGNFILTAISP
jgi:hypothetical protein